MQANKLYFKNLDTIRFIAALMVFLDNAIRPSFRYLGIDGTLLAWMLDIISKGGTGVSIFFVLSGFLITYLLVSEHEVSHKISLKKFYMRRVLRIWPLYYLVIIVIFIVFPFLKSLGFMGYNSISHSNLFCYLTFLSNFDWRLVDIHFPGEKHVLAESVLWSISVEEQFYFFWPLLFVFFPKRFWGYLIVSVILASAVFRIINHKDVLILYVHTLSVLIDLGIGGLMAYLVKTKVRIRTYFESVTTSTHLSFFLFSAGLLMCNQTIVKYEYGNALSRILISLSFAFIIAAQAMTVNKSALNLGNFSFATKWGKYTYGIYLLHPLVVTFLNVIMRLTYHPYHNLLTRFHIPYIDFLIVFSFGFLAAPVTLLISWFSYEYFESRFLALKSKFEVIKTDQ
jgi:peptidoglycan/LPS O-acetylase OafA/YrhL